MPKYNVKEAFELEGTQHEVDSQVELTEEVAAQLLTDGCVELVA